MTTGGPEVEDLLRLLTRRSVEFVIIGGVAVVLQGHVRYTADVDVYYRDTEHNRKRLAQALVEIDARDARDPERWQAITPDSLVESGVWQWETALGRLDTLAGPRGVGPYEEVSARADSMQLASGETVRVAATADLIAMKRAEGRPQDLLDVEALTELERRGS